MDNIDSKEKKERIKAPLQDILDGSILTRKEIVNGLIIAAFLVFGVMSGLALISGDEEFNGNERERKRKKEERK